jgi:hypothetical protein
MLLLKPISPEARLNDKTPYLPAAQSKHVLSEEAPIAAEYFPAAQAMHMLSVEAPIAAEYFPAAQSKQLLAPEYLPAVQAAQAPNALHAAVKPVSVSAGFAQKKILRKPVVDV